MLASADKEEGRAGVRTDSHLCGWGNVERSVEKREREVQEVV